MASPKTFQQFGGAGFDLFDWNRNYASTVDNAPDSFDAALTDSTYGILLQPDVYLTGSVTASGDNIALAAGGHLLHATSVPTVHAFEAAFLMTEAGTPDTFSSGRSGMGVVDAQNGCFRLLFSKTGAGYLKTLDAAAEPSLLSDSAVLFANFPFWLTVRVVATEEQIELYMTATYGGEDTTRNFYITLPPALTGVENIVDVFSTHHAMTVGSMRLSSLALRPNLPPVALINASSTGTVGRSTLLDGSGSSDPEGTPITFTWEILSAPDNARPLLSGLTQASTIVEDAIGTDLAQVVLTYMGDAGNNYRLTTFDNGVGAPYDFSSATVAGITTISLGVPTGTAMKHLVLAINEPTKYGQDSSFGDLLEATTLGTGVEPVPFDTFTFSGGIDSTYSEVSFVPTLPGTYEIGLTVNDGELDSEQDSVSITVLAAEHVLGTLPDAAPIWKALPDFWEIVQGDKRVLETIWSSIMQVVSAELFKAWQDDYSKSLRDIPAVYQRKWVGFNPVVTVSGSVAGYPGFKRVACTHQDDDDDDLYTPYLIQTGELAASYRALVVENATAWDCMVDSSYENQHANITSEYLTYTSLGSGTRSGVVTKIAGAWETFRLTSGALPEDIVDKILIIDGTHYRIATRDSNTQLTINNAPGTHPFFRTGFCTRAYGTALTPAAGVSWEIAEPHAEAILAFSMPYFNVTRQAPVESTARVEVVIAGETHTLNLPILYSNQSVAYVDWTPLGVYIRNNITSDTILEYSYAAGASTQIVNYLDGIGAVTQVCTLLQYLDVSLVGYVQQNNLLLPDGVVEVPTLAMTITGTPYLYVTDYTLRTLGDSNQYIVWNPETLSVEWNSTTVRTTAQPDVIYLDAGFVLAPYGWETEVDADGDPTGYYTASVGYAPTADGTFAGWGPRHLLSELPTSFWAELVLFNNDEVIESNFGAVVGLPKVEQENYKSDVTALWFAFWHGPRVGNIDVALNAFLDRQLFLVDGTIVDINENFTASDGRVYVQGLEAGTDEGVIYSFSYNASLGLATNPDTGVAYALGDTVSRFWPVQAGVETADYITDPDWFATLFTGYEQLKKYHTFVVKLTPDGASIDYAALQALIMQLRPEYTAPIIIMVLLEQTDIDVVEIVTNAVTVFQQDNPSTAYFTTPSAADPLTNTSQAFPARYPQFAATPAGLAEGTPADNMEVYESGYTPGRLDNYSGDGSWHTDAPLNPLESGTTTAYAAGIARDDTKTWTVDEWAGKEAYFPSIDEWSTIVSNTVDTFTITPVQAGLAGGGGDNFTFFDRLARVEFVNQLDHLDIDYGKSIYWLPITLTSTAPPLDFELGEWIEAATGARSRIVHISTFHNQQNHVNGFLLCQALPTVDTESIPYGPDYLLDFVTGDAITGDSSGATADVLATPMLYPTYIFELDIGEFIPESTPFMAVPIYAGNGGRLSSLDVGLVVDDVEVYQTPTAITTPVLVAANEVPSFHYGQYWWLDTPLMLDYEDAAPPAAWEPPEPTLNINGSVLTVAPTTLTAPGGTFTAADVGKKMYVHSPTFLANNAGTWEVLTWDNPGGAWVTVDNGGSFTNENPVHWYLMPSWWTAGWRIVDPSYVARDAIVLRGEEGTFKGPNITHGHTRYPVSTLLSTPVVLAIVEAAAE